ncbi:otogelin-like protein [Petromyzon marinus]|uniref:otogelin-like protein n=1 Tax=Petromyzon marinus TaxID=7757 RepID=UPI003F70B248
MTGGPWTLNRTTFRSPSTEIFETRSPLWGVVTASPSPAKVSTPLGKKPWVSTTDDSLISTLPPPIFTHTVAAKCEESTWVRVSPCVLSFCLRQRPLLLNLSDLCPPSLSPPGGAPCGLLGAPLRVDSDPCCPPRWECPCRCSLFPELHVVTFDGQAVAMVKPGAYTLSVVGRDSVYGVVSRCPHSPLVSVGGEGGEGGEGGLHTERGGARLGVWCGEQLSTLTTGEWGW